MRTRITERDITRIVRKIIKEQEEITCSCPELKKFMSDGLEQARGMVEVVKGGWRMVDEDTISFSLPNGKNLTLNVTE